MATYSGTDLGIVEVCEMLYAPKERQINAYPGINGLQVIDHGTRGATTMIRGLLSGTSLSNLVSKIATLNGYVTGGALATFVDTRTTSWSNVLLVVFRPVGPIYPMPGGYYCTRYEAEFLHPTL